MYSEKMAALGKKRSAIRELFEYSQTRKREIGNDKVFDYSIGNPSVPAPAIVNETLVDLIQNTDSVLLHGYTSAQGDAEVRRTVADYIGKTFGAEADENRIYMTTGAAAALSICFNALCTGNDEIITFAPYFPEYKVFIEGANCRHIVVKPDEKLMPDLDALEKAINMHTKAVVINSPNNPSGVIYGEEVIKAIAALLERKSKEYSHPIFIIADEPYRELVYDNREVPYIPNYYEHTIVCYSFSKVWSIPGERIGYIFVSPRMKEAADIFAAVCGAGRSLGYVCASSLFQRLVMRCIGTVGDTETYKINRDILYNALTEYGFRCVHPDGAFYLFVKAPVEDASEFAEEAKKRELLIVPADSFGCPGYVRISYCVTKEQIENSLPAFKDLAKHYGLIG